MLGVETRPPPAVHRDLAPIRRAFATCVAPLGAAPINRLEALLERKFALAHRLVEAPPEEPDRRVADVLSTFRVGSAHRAAILASVPAERFRSAARRIERGPFGPRDLPGLAEEFGGVPAEVRADLAAELAHAIAPDRIALLTRWVWNPARGQGLLGELVRPPPESLEGAQAALGEARLELAALGFPSPTFASVDILLALAYAPRLATATERSFQGGGIESLLPGAYGLAAMILGIRRWEVHADR